MLRKPRCSPPKTKPTSRRCSRLKAEAPNIYRRATFRVRALALADELAVAPEEPMPALPIPTDEERRAELVQAKRTQIRDAFALTRAKLEDIAAAQKLFEASDV